MADIRIKDLATTATTTASDDFMAVDGATNGTRKLSAATPAFLTSVTTPSLTSPASTNLTLAGGAGNSSVILTPAGTGNVGIGTTTPNSQLDVYKASTGGKLRLSSNTNATYGELIFSSNDASYLTYGSSIEGTGDSNGLNVGDLIFKTGYGEVRTERMKINRSGVVTLANTTAGSSGAGALVVAGGLATGAVSNMKSVALGYDTTQYANPGTLSNYSATNNVYLNGNTAGGLSLAGDGTQFSALSIAGGSTGTVIIKTANTARLTIDGTTGAATFAGAVISSVSTGSKTLQATASVSVLTNAVQNLVAQNYGFFFISEITITGSVAIIAFNAGGPFIVWQQGTDYSITANTASKFNVYYSSGNQLVVQNKKTSTADFNILNFAGPS